MRTAKKKKLEAKAWRVGNAEEFLALSPKESAYIKLKLKLAESVRARRVGLDLTQQELAELIHSSRSRIAKIDSGDASVTIDLMICSLIALGVSNRDLARIIARNGRVDSSLARPQPLLTPLRTSVGCSRRFQLDSGPRRSDVYQASRLPSRRRMSALRPSARSQRL